MERKDRMIKLKKSGLSYQAIANLYNISRSRVHQILSGYNSNKLNYRRIIFERDNFTCQWGEICKNKKVSKINLIVHHIDFNDKNNKFSNLITLCKKCHSKFHRSNHINNKIEKKLQKAKSKGKEIIIYVNVEEYKTIKKIKKKEGFLKISDTVVFLLKKNII